MKAGCREIPLSCCSVVAFVWCSMKHAKLMLHEKYNTLKIYGKHPVWNKSIYKHWKILVEWNHMLLGYIILVLKVSNNHSCCWLLFCLIVQRGVAFQIGRWMKIELCRESILCSNCILLKLKNFCSYTKRKWVKSKLCMANWPCRVWLQRN